MISVRAAAARWADTWKRGWESLDADPIVALYAGGAVLSTEPFREPYRGRDGVRTCVTRVFGEEADPRVWVSEPIVDGARASVSWWASLREDGAAWNILPERRSPPEGFGPFA